MYSYYNVCTSIIGFHFSSKIILHLWLLVTLHQPISDDKCVGQTFLTM